MRCSQSSWRKKFESIHTVSTIELFACELNWLDAFGMVSFVLALNNKKHKHKKNLMKKNGPCWFRMIRAHKRMCGGGNCSMFLCDKLFNLMKETYAMQTCFMRCAMAKLLNELKKSFISWREKLANQIDMRSSLAWRASWRKFGSCSRRLS